MSFSRLFRSRHTTSRSSGPTTTEEVTAVVGFSQWKSCEKDAAVGAVGKLASLVLQMQDC